MGMEWRFLYEALIHISSLRLLLTKESVSPSESCKKLKASLRFQSCLELVCEWEAEGEEQGKLRVPLPLCPLDHSVAPEAVAREDHIEVKLRLLEGGVHLLRTCLLDGKNPAMCDAAELSLRGSEMKCFCKACKKQITKGEFNTLLELPSIDWREATDDWFGICCCGSSIRTESIVAGFEKNIFPSEGKFLLGSTTCIVHSRNLCDSQIPSEKHDYDAIYPSSTEAHYETDICDHKNCSEHSAKDNRILTTTPGLYDFLKGPVRPVSVGSWQALRCGNCSSTIGAYIDSHDRMEQAVHLFKRHISAAANSQTDPFRHHTLQNDFMKELLSQIEHNSAYRYIVRGLRMKKPVLRLVITNEHSLVFCGLLDESVLDVGSLKPAVSVMFHDCSVQDEKEIQIVEDWCARYNVDDIFVLEEEIPFLLDSLRANRLFFPDSYGVMENFSLSFLAA